jgi:hypothetical protein
MSRFLEIYVHDPIGSLLAEMPKEPADVPEMTLRMEREKLAITVANDTMTIHRSPSDGDPSDDDVLPDDVDEYGPGPT